MTAIGVLGVKLASVVTAKAVALSSPYLLDKNPRKPSRVEQRRIDIAQAVPPLPVAKVAASVDAATPYDVLASQLDLAEAVNAKAEPGRARARRAKFPLRRLASKFATPPAADAFNRSFGVIPIASN
jgi:hypothetical protein